MDYPWCVLRTDVRPAPILGEVLKGPPYTFSFSGPAAEKYAVRDHLVFAHQIDTELSASGSTWGVGAYLEDRRALLRDYPQMIADERVYHAGLDIMAPATTPVLAPLDGVVDARGFDEGLGNYGRYLRLRHEIHGGVFFTFYGHLERDSRAELGASVSAGDAIARLGLGEDAGGWFPHLHLQVLTPRAVSEGLNLVGYVDRAMREEIDAYFPSPWPLFRM